ncbi:hypothetical protein Smp_182950 [Schistosoma mansoni]|nr:hypothetical protein Smp_182920 [Schistosoma mansoni]XP_018646744.1 hypothetical protein Smp_183550 [Schistosoma mansoni]XP_018646747.1 hypothetical protein Smp_182950 [Schistosoma mansoni]|eukprot:XP_018646740.1 hypothetical protein Smp_182920 [Schistosoma mansoni]
MTDPSSTTTAATFGRSELFCNTPIALHTCSHTSFNTCSHDMCVRVECID